MCIIIFPKLAFVRWTSPWAGDRHGGRSGGGWMEDGGGGSQVGRTVEAGGVGRTVELSCVDIQCFGEDSFHVLCLPAHFYIFAHF